MRCSFYHIAYRQAPVPPNFTKYSIRGQVTELITRVKFSSPCSAEFYEI